MKKPIFFIMFFLIARAVLAHYANTVFFLPLATDTSNEVGSYTWSNYGGLSFETKDGYAACKFESTNSDGCVLPNDYVTETIKTITFDIWVKSSHGTSSDWRFFTTNDINNYSMQYYDNQIHLYSYLSSYPGQDRFEDTWSTYIPEDQWINIGFTWDTANNESKFYVNGTLKVTYQCHGAPAGKAFYVQNTSWSITQGADVWIRNFRGLSSVETSFPIVDTTPTYTPTYTKTVTPTVTATVTPTITPTITETVTNTVTPTITETITPTVTPTITPSVTETVTPTVTPTVTKTVSPTVTPTVTKTITPTYTATPDKNIVKKDSFYKGPLLHWFNFFRRER